MSATTIPPLRFAPPRVDTQTGAAASRRDSATRHEGDIKVRLARRLAASIPAAGLTLALGAALAFPAITHQAPLGGYATEHGTGAAVAAAKPTNTPEWLPHYARRHRGCVHAFADPSRIPSYALAVNLDGDLVKISVDEVWRRSHDTNAANDVWVVGVCR